MANPAVPEEMWTGVPPAKSRPPALYTHPLGFQVQHAIGSYTIVDQTNTKTSNGPSLERSATAPMASIGLGSGRHDSFDVIIVLHIFTRWFRTAWKAGEKVAIMINSRESSGRQSRDICVHNDRIEIFARPEVARGIHDMSPSMAPDEGKSAAVGETGRMAEDRGYKNQKSVILAECVRYCAHTL